MAAARELSNLQEAQQSARTLMWDGVLWLVYEFVQSLDRRQSPSLIFESDGTMRRIRNYPANWRALTDDQLIALSWTV